MRNARETEEIPALEKAVLYLAHQRYPRSAVEHLLLFSILKKLPELPLHASVHCFVVTV